MQALRLIDLYAKKGFDLNSKRIYIKVTSNTISMTLISGL